MGHGVGGGPGNEWRGMGSCSCQADDAVRPGVSHQKKGLVIYCYQHQRAYSPAELGGPAAAARLAMAFQARHRWVIQKIDQGFGIHNEAVVEEAMRGNGVMDKVNSFFRADGPQRLFFFFQGCRSCCRR